MPAAFLSVCDNDPEQVPECSRREVTVLGVTRRPERFKGNTREREAWMRIEDRARADLVSAPVAVTQGMSVLARDGADRASLLAVAETTIVGWRV